MFMTNLILTGTAALFAGLSISVSGAGLPTVKCAEAQPGQVQENPAASGEICKAPHGNPAGTTEDGNDSCAKHFSATFVPECRIKTELFDFLARTESDGCPVMLVQKSAEDESGYRIGTPSGLYASAVSGGEDRAAAAGSGTSPSERSVGTAGTSGSAAGTPGAAAATSGAATGTPGTAAATSGITAGTSGTAATTSGGAAAGTDSAPADAGTGSDDHYAPAADSGSTAAASDTGTPASTDAGTDNRPAEAAPATDNSSPAVDNRQDYHHTTSIYTNDESTLLRVEYYDENNTLFEYSSVSDYDKDTNSYTETVYQYDEENQVSVVTRTDTYVNGELISSETP